jgi:hypothetical protein
MSIEATPQELGEISGTEITARLVLDDRGITLEVEGAESYTLDSARLYTVGETMPIMAASAIGSRMLKALDDKLGLIVLQNRERNRRNN